MTDIETPWMGYTPIAMAVVVQMRKQANAYAAIQEKKHAGEVKRRRKQLKKSVFGVKVEPIGCHWSTWVYGGGVNPYKNLLAPVVRKRCKGFNDDKSEGKVLVKIGDDIEVAEVIDLSPLNSSKKAKKFWEKRKTTVFRRYKYRCAVKGCPVRGKKNLSVHHIIPRADGGLDDIDNLIPLCTKHHDMVEMKDITSRVAIENLAIDAAEERSGIDTAPRKVSEKTRNQLRQILKVLHDDFDELAKRLGYKRPGASITLFKIVNNEDQLVERNQLTELRNRIAHVLSEMEKAGQVEAQPKNIKNKIVEKKRKAAKALSADPRLDDLSDAAMLSLADGTRNFISASLDDPDALGAS
jgi:uncharacterized protein YfcZ (UPF0381/DUF406 family)